MIRNLLHLCLVAVVALLCPVELSGREGAMNVLFIAVDDLRPQLGCFGDAEVVTPNIDRFAASSLLFERAYCQQAVCNPSRTSLMTGLRPDTIGVTGNHIHFRSNTPDVVTLPQHFKNHGYHARAIGKIYHGVFPEGASITTWDTMGDPQSWSEPAVRFGPRYYYTEAGIAAARREYERVYKPENPGPDDWTTKLVFGPATEAPEVADNTLYDGKVADSAIEAIEQFSRRPETPFFLAVGFIKPHSPYIAPRKYFDLYDEVSLPEQDSFPESAPTIAGHSSGELRRYTDQPRQEAISEDNGRRVRHAYYACVSYIDAQIGRVLDELEARGLADETIVVLFGDHGYHLGELGLWGKTTNFELDTRVPLLVRVPGSPSAGQTTDAIVELVDLYPTLSQLAGLPVGDHLEGTSFEATLQRPEEDTDGIALSQYPRRGGLMGYSLRTAQHRLTHWIHLESGEVRATELYDYGGGLVETRNIESESPEIVEQLAPRLREAFSLDAPSAEDRVIVSFENLPAGEFDTIETPLGVMSTSGFVKIDNEHARTGTQCLQIAEGASVEIKLAEGIATDGQLSFHAERWTRRDPFSFRIEKRTTDGWTEIYNGDREIAVGRAFLSHVVVPLADSGISALRFSCNSPPETGVLVDDLAISPAERQQIVNVEIVPLALPALVGNPDSALLKLKIETRGTLEPVTLRAIHASLAGTCSTGELTTMQVFYTGSNPDFSSDELFGERTRPQRKPSFPGTQQLAEGDNYFWIGCTLSDAADIDKTVGAAIENIEFAGGEEIVVDSEPSIQRLGVAVRNHGDDGVHTFRIPGLATTNAGSLIGVYDIRRDGGGDLPGNIDVGMSRSTDGGRTWEPMKVIMDMGDDPAWNRDGIGDPAILVDRVTGAIWVAATWSHGNRSWRGSGPGLTPEETGQFMLVSSDDDGVTWSDPINITEQVKNPDWCFLLQGPGKGITMSDGTLVFPAQYQDPPDENDRRAHRLPHSTIIYSRDRGESWQIAGGACDDTTESQIVELADGELMINCRNNREAMRAILTTSDMGQSWQEHPTHVEALIEPGSCMASLINVGRELKWRGLEGFNNELLLFSNPDSLRGRNHITIKASLDSGRTWLESHQLLLDEQTGAGYSCMAMIDEETVGILYEGSQAHMTFQRVRIIDILQPPVDQKTKNPATAGGNPDR